MNSWSDSKIFKFFDTCMTVHRVFGYHLRQLRKHDWHLSMRHAAWVEHDSFQSLSIVQKLQFLRTMALLVCTFSYVKYLTMQLSWIEKVMATNSLINSKIFHYILCNTAQKCFHWWSQSGKHQISTSYQYQPIPRTALTRYVRCCSEAGIPMISWYSCGEDIYFYLMTSGL